VVSAELPEGQGDALRTLTAPMGADWTNVRLLIPGSVPAGEYAGELTWSDGSFPVVIAVRADTRVHVVPPDLRVRAGGGQTATVSVVVHNAGNVPVEVRKVDAVALEHSRALDRAIIAGLTGKARHLDRFGVAADSLADDQVGVARAVVVGGGGTVAPGETREVVLELRLPDKLDAGTTYAGNWSVGGVEVPVLVEAVARQDEPPEPPRGRAPRKTTKGKP
jgi:hypothetical protein